MPLVGFLTRRVQLRYLAAFGLCVQALALYNMSRFPADLSFNHTVWARIFQGVGIGFLFVPINTLSYHGLSMHKNNVASSMLSVARNVGGSVGIALATTLLAHRAQYHRAVLTEHISAYSFPANEALNALQGRMETAGATDPMASSKALGAVSGMIDRQAFIMAFNDVAWVLALVCAVCLLTVPLLDPVKAERGAGGH
jgi:DHA2 family multidrug resistance protein